MNNNIKDLIRNIKKYRNENFVYKDMEQILVDELSKSINKSIMEKLIDLNLKKPFY